MHEEGGFSVYTLLLARGWRILINPNSLVLWIVKDKYHKLNYYGSENRVKTLWGLESIFEGRKVLGIGLRYGVWNGKDYNLKNP